MSNYYPIDRISQNGDIREHMTRDGRRTLCGLTIDASQDPAGNTRCGRCRRITAKFPAPPVCTARWDSDDWDRYIARNAQHEPTVIQNTLGVFVKTGKRDSRGNSLYVMRGEK